MGIVVALPSWGFRMMTSQPRIRRPVSVQEMLTVVIPTVGAILASHTWENWGPGAVGEALHPGAWFPHPGALSLGQAACGRVGSGGLTFIALARWVVKGQPQGDDGCDFQNDQRHVL